MHLKRTKPNLRVIRPMPDCLEYDSPSIIAEESRRQMKILMVEPKTPTSYWSYDHALSLIGKKASFAPLGLMTLAGLLPEEWDISLIDLNTSELRPDDIQRADAVFVGGMHIQRESFHEIVRQAQDAGKPVVGGGPYVTSSPEECQDLDHLVLGEAEGGIEEWARNFEAGQAPQITTMPPTPKLDMIQESLPRYDLINPADYFAMSVQLSRGCPHGCEFCSVTELNGRNPRIKPIERLLAELETIRQSGFRGSTMVVDDNFIGRWKKVEEMLPQLAEWQKRHGYPLDLFTQTSMKLAEHDELMAGMVEAGFSGVFLGIETPSKKTLQTAGKYHNASMDLNEGVNKIARAGLEPMAGFIFGLDGDTKEDLDEIGRFIQRNPIPSAMIGLPQAIPGTKLHKRMEKEGRLLSEYNGDLQHYSGDQFDGANYQTEIDPGTLRQKYAQILTDTYEPGRYFDRCRRLMEIKGSPKHSLYRHRLGFGVNAFIHSVIEQGLCGKYRLKYLEFLAKVAAKMPQRIGEAVTYAVKLHHYHTYTHQNVLPRLAQ